jgi:3-isopropylmalate dehydratase small subunit
MPEPVSNVVGKAVPLEVDDVDTDQIIPAEFLKLIQRKGLGQYLFYAWRYQNMKLTNQFILDDAKYRDAKVLVASRNFGIGSSRENAVWAIADFGIRCVLASSFGDIFYTNASKNGLVCIRLPAETLRELRQQAASGDLILDVDIARSTITSPKGVISFQIEPDVRERLLKGYDDIEITLSNYGGELAEHEARMQKFFRPNVPSE